MRDHVRSFFKILLVATISIGAFICLGQTEEIADIRLGLRSMAVQAFGTPSQYEDIIVQEMRENAKMHGCSEFLERAERYRHVIEAEERLAALDERAADAALAELEWKRAQRCGKNAQGDLQTDPE